MKVLGRKLAELVFSSNFRLETLSSQLDPPSPIRRLVNLQEFIPDVVAGVESIDDGVHNPGGAIDVSGRSQRACASTFRKAISYPLF